MENCLVFLNSKSFLKLFFLGRFEELYFFLIRYQVIQDFYVLKFKSSYENKPTRNVLFVAYAYQVNLLMLKVLISKW